MSNRVDEDTIYRAVGNGEKMMGGPGEGGYGERKEMVSGGEKSCPLDTVHFRILFYNPMELTIRYAARQMIQDMGEPLGPGTYTWKSSTWRWCLKLRVRLKEKVNKEKKKPSPRYLACRRLEEKRTEP